MYIIILNIIHHHHLYFSSKIDSVFYLLRILRPFIFFIPTKKRIIFPPEIFIVFMLKRIAPEITFHSSSELQALCIITHLLYYTAKYKNKQYTIYKIYK